MIKTITKIVDGIEYDYTFSNLGFYIQNENKQIFEEAYDLKGHSHIYIETDEPIKEFPDEEVQKKWKDFMIEYRFMFGDQEYSYSKYKIVKECMNREIWTKIKENLSDDMKDLFDAAIEFVSTDEFFIQGVFFIIEKLGMTLLDIRNMLDTCIV